MKRFSQLYGYDSELLLAIIAEGEFVQCYDPVFYFLGVCVYMCFL